MESRRIEFRAMGSKILGILDREESAHALQQLPAWFEAWEQVLSRFRIDSELTRLNARPGTRVRVSATLWEVHCSALMAYELTGGLVNAVILEDVIRAGYDRSFEDMEKELAAAAGAAPQEMVDFAFQESSARPEPGDLVVDMLNQELRLPEGTGLDFGGVAKGWSANEAMQRLSANGPVLVSAGGDIAVSGPRANGDPWAIAVEDPLRPGGYTETLYLDSGGVATSGRDRRQWRRSGVPMHHIVDPRTGWPAETDILSATVVARNSMEAEALAKAVLILGSAEGMEWLETVEGAAALLVLQSGNLLYSRRIEEYL